MLSIICIIPIVLWFFFHLLVDFSLDVCVSVCVFDSVVLCMYTLILNDSNQ